MRTHRRGGQAGCAGTTSASPVPTWDTSWRPGEHRDQFRAPICRVCVTPCMPSGPLVRQAAGCGRVARSGRARPRPRSAAVTRTRRLRPAQHTPAPPPPPATHGHRDILPRPPSRPRAMDSSAVPADEIRRRGVIGMQVPADHPRPHITEGSHLDIPAGPQPPAIAIQQQPAPHRRVYTASRPAGQPGTPP